MMTFPCSSATNYPPPTKIKVPKTFEKTDLYPALTINATRQTVGKFGDVVEREDEQGTCLVAHFEVFGTLVMFYQSALDAIDHWTVFVDMLGCVARMQLPSRLGVLSVRYLADGRVSPNWVNKEVDTEYRSRRRSRRVADAVGVPLVATRATKALVSKMPAERGRKSTANDAVRTVARPVYEPTAGHDSMAKIVVARTVGMKMASAPARTVTAKTVVPSKK